MGAGGDLTKKTSQVVEKEKKRRKNILPEAGFLNIHLAL